MALSLRLLLPLAALALVAPVTSHPRQDAKVTYVTKAKRADLVLADIAAQTGRTIETTPDAALHFLVIAVQDASVDKLLEEIAKVTSSKWNVVGDKWILLADTAVRKAEQDKKDAKRVEQFKKAQEMIRKELAKKPGNPEDENYEWPMLESPAEKALAQIALLIDPKEAAKLEEDGRVVFSTRPNKMQRPMTSNQVTNILNTLVKDHNAYAAQKIKESEDMKKAMSDMGEDMTGWDMFDEKYYLFESAPAKALVILQLDGAEYGMPGENANAKLVVYDQKGKAIVTTSITLSPDVYDRQNYADMVDPSTGEVIGNEKEAQKPISDEDRTPITLSEDSKTLQTIAMGEDFTFNIPEPVKALLRDPVTKDPLSFHVSDGLHSVAKVKKLNLVANIADSETENGFLGMDMDPEGGGTTVGAVFAQFTEGEQPEGVVKDGWLTVMPRDPVAARKFRQDRAVLKQFVASVEANGRASLDTLATFALNSPTPMSNGMSIGYLVAFAPSMLQGLMGDTMDWEMLKFYGSLQPPQKSTLRAGGKVPFNALSVQARNIVTEMAFGSNANIKTLDKMKEEATLPFFMTMWMDMSGRESKTYAEEPTELMPNGLPGAGWVELAVTGETIINSEGTASAFFLGFGGMGAGEIAMMEIMSEAAQNEGGGEGDFFKMPETGKLGSRDRLKFSFWLSPEAGLTKTLLDDTSDKNAKTISLSQLPPEFRAEIEKKKKEIKDSPYGRMIGGIGMRQ